MRGDKFSRKLSDLCFYGSQKILPAGDIPDDRHCKNTYIGSSYSAIVSHTFFHKQWKSLIVKLTDYDHTINNIFKKLFFYRN